MQLRLCIKGGQNILQALNDDYFANMSRIFVVGDHKTGTGPANVTKEYIVN